MTSERRSYCPTRRPRARNRAPNRRQSDELFVVSDTLTPLPGIDTPFERSGSRSRTVSLFELCFCGVLVRRGLTGVVFQLLHSGPKSAFSYCSCFRYFTAARRIGC